MAFSCLSENEFTEHEKNLKREASVRNLSAALLPRVLRWLTYYFVERALLVKFYFCCCCYCCLVRSALGGEEKRVGAKKNEMAAQPTLLRGESIMQGDE